MFSEDANSSMSTQAVAARLQATHQSKVYKRTQRLDGNQLSLLFYTLNRPNLGDNVRDGTVLPPGAHLIYFTPRTTTNRLNEDGTDSTFTAEPPFQRRIWGGGEMVWERANPLLVGDTVLETTQLETCEVKRDAQGDEMLLLTVARRLENGKGLAVTDRRHVLLRQNATSNSRTTEKGPSQSQRHPGPSTAQALQQGANPKALSRTVRLDEVTVFRYSALTFNSHRIHYSLPWARDVEKYPQLLAQGPLGITLLLDLWGDSRATQQSDSDLEDRPQMPTSARKLTYQSMKPLFVNETCNLNMLERGAGMALLWIQKEDGTVGMKAEIECFQLQEKL
ncbi:uncharacterized protein PV07_08839 [Cladophialophora immunda]|uniref:N-terminal of MaoC-like dehydratase domain-containing protein n=1 Tax=Cladophialophora immunda TaxID=569365 RepID=A0A0D2C384_9EURO|nr:uncharacterized protein PV07_08839 [Cladophialophora immunda]KIW25678.1 hypothetical protein PV07_08839 [Cladophialophora immunda]OQU96342.1 hypothetical protein CLAIMM_02439 [Cladophialophora immunda]